MLGGPLVRGPHLRRYAGGRIRPGRLILNRYRLGEPWELDSLRRAWNAEDVQTGAAVTVVALRGHVALRPGAREAWAQFQPGAHPALSPILDRGEADDAGTRVLFRVYPAFHLAPRVLEPATVEGLVPWLAGGLDAAALPELEPGDLVVDAGGVPRLIPSGLPPSPSLGRATIVEPDPARRARISLAALLRSRLGDTPAPPALQRLPDVSVGSTPEPPRLPVPAPGSTTPNPAQVRTTTTPLPAPSVRSRRRYRVLVPIRALAAADRDRALRRSGVAPASWSRLSERPVAWRMLATDDEAEADALVLRLQRSGLPASRSDTQPNRSPMFMAAGLALAALTSTLLFGPLMVLVSVLLGLLSVGLGGRSWLQQARLKAADQAWDSAAAAPVDPLTALRRLAVDPELSATVRQDLGQMLDDAEDRAEERAAQLRHGDTLPAAERSATLDRLRAEARADEVALQALLSGLSEVHHTPGDAAAPIARARQQLRSVIST